MSLAQPIAGENAGAGLKFFVRLAGIIFFMRSLWQNLSKAVGGAFLSALLMSGGFLLLVMWDQSHWWRIKEDYSFGWLVPAFVAFVVYDRWAKISAAAAACAAPGSPRAAGWRGALLGLLNGGLLVGGVLLFLLGALLRVSEGLSAPGTAALTLGACAITLGLLWLNAPAVAAPGAAAGLRDDARVGLVSLFLFPALVWVVSAPLVASVEARLNLFLLGRVVGVVSTVFDVLGLPIEQQGNVLVLPTGRVGVEEACSGIRSLTACLFAGSFLAAVFLDKLWKKVALVVAAMVLAFLTNLLRGLFLTGWAYRNGAESIEGTVHDTAGYAVLGLTLVGLLCLLPIFNLKFSGGAEEDGEEKPEAGAKTD